jgi:hypothetical protein
MNRLRISARCRLFTIFTSLLLGAATAQAGGTVVGNGGDPIFVFLEAARTSLTETLKILLNDPAERSTFCSQAGLTDPQAQFCRSYFSQILEEILERNQVSSKTPFEPRDYPLYVPGPSGLPMVVSARTEVGPLGSIEFNRDAVKTMPPTEILFLMAHEFQHKVLFNNAYVTDNDPIGPFAIGRDLIDAAAKSVVVLAKRTGNVGFQFGIKDIFNCLADNGTAKFGAVISSERLYRSEDLMSYESSFGKNPGDNTIYYPDTSARKLLLRLEIFEPNNCGDANPRRLTKIEVIERLEMSGGRTQDTVLAHNELTINPICPSETGGFEISSGQVHFTCKYFGSQGTTKSSQFQKKP